MVVEEQSQEVLPGEGLGQPDECGEQNAAPIVRHQGRGCVQPTKHRSNHHIHVTTLLTVCYSHDLVMISHRNMRQKILK